MNRTLVTIANDRDWVNGRSILRGIITKDDMYRPGPYDRGKWSAQGYANTMGRHVFVSIEGNEGFIECVPVFPIDDEEYDYTEEERGEEDWYDDKEDRPEYRPVDRRHAEYVEEMRKEGRWQGDKNHPKYPWRKE